jgi:hypothetical protein
VLPFIGGMRPLIGGRSVTPFCRHLCGQRSPIFTPLYCLKWPIFDHEAVRFRFDETNLLRVIAASLPFTPMSHLVPLLEFNHFRVVTPISLTSGR